MLLLTLFMPRTTIWFYAAGFEIMLILLGALFVYMYLEGHLPYYPQQIQE
jgi:hypothetical protein